MQATCQSGWSGEAPRQSRNSTCRAAWTCNKHSGELLRVPVIDSRMPCCSVCLCRYGAQSLMLTLVWMYTEVCWSVCVVALMEKGSGVQPQTPVQRTRPQCEC